MTSSRERPSWASSVEWTKADLLNPESYKPYLNGANAVVHTMGILLEADYKGVVQGREPIVSGLQRAFSSSKLGSQNPLERQEGEPLEPKEGDRQLTYELMNRDSGSYHDHSLVFLTYYYILMRVKPLHWHRSPQMRKFRRSHTYLLLAEHRCFPPDTSQLRETLKRQFHPSSPTCEVYLCAPHLCMTQAGNSHCQ